MTYLRYPCWRWRSFRPSYTVHFAITTSKNRAWVESEKKKSTFFSSQFGLLHGRDFGFDIKSFLLRPADEVIILLLHF